MNLHVLADQATAIIGRVFAGRDRFFARSVDGPPITEAVRETRVRAPEIDGEGEYETDADGPAGSLDPAFKVARWLDDDRPTLLYIQGSGERPFDFSSRSKNSFRLIVLDAEPGWDANLVVLRAPFHTGSERDYARAMGELVNFTGMIAALVVLTDRLVDQLHARGDAPVIVAGISLGGWATNLHAALLGSADTYLPLLAGTALDDLFLHSSYRRMTDPDARSKPDILHHALNFEAAFRDAPHDRVFPLLAEHDRFIRYGRQTESYGPVSIAGIDRGHVTTVASPALVQDHLRRFLPTQSAS